MAQGDFYAGISLGYDLRLFLPLNISAFEVKDNKLKDWCKSWMGSDYSPPLEPEDWFGKGHKYLVPTSSGSIGSNEAASQVICVK